MQVIDQRDIQRRGGICTRSPISCMISDLLKEADIEPARVFDITYGEGRWWQVYRPSILIGADIAVHEWLVAPDLFIPKPAWHSYRVLQQLGIRVDLVAVDPPWVSKGYTKRPHFGIDKMIGSPMLILDSAAKAAEALGSNYLLLHYKDRWVPDGWRIVVEKEWIPFGRYINKSKKKPSTWFAVLAKN